jgi:hypothetical protein
MLVFSSLEEFLTGYIAAKDGSATRGAIDFPGRWMPSSYALSDVLESVGFASIETLYLPIGIPEDFRLHLIRVTDIAVSFEYLHKDDMLLDEASRNRASRDRQFTLAYFMFDMDYSYLVDAMLRQSYVSFGVRATENDLIDGRYFFDGRYSFTWVHGRERFTLRTPGPSHIDFGAETTVNAHGEVVFSNPADMVQFLEIRTVDLTDPEQIEALLAELNPLS